MFYKDLATFNAVFSLGLGAILVGSPTLIKGEIPEGVRGYAARILYEISLFIFTNIALFFSSYLPDNNILQTTIFLIIIVVLVILMYEIPMFIYKIVKMSESVAEVHRRDERGFMGKIVHRCKGLVQTKVINCDSLELKYDLRLIGDQILQLLKEADKNVKFRNLDRNIDSASRLELEVLVGFINANIEKRKVTEFTLVLFAIIIAIATVSKINFILIISLIIVLYIIERFHNNRIERLVLARDLLLVYIKEKFCKY